MIRVSAPSRLHFGLFHIPSEQDAVAAVPPRQYGGVGLMIDKPGVKVSLAPAAAWSATGPCADRALAFAREFMRQCPEIEAIFALTVERCAAQHVGLGTGTQLGLAVAKALAIALGQPEWTAAELARRIGRGLRSGIGVHGFDNGGLIVDGGKGALTTIAPLVARREFPSDWAILLIVPNHTQGVHGDQERAAAGPIGEISTRPAKPMLYAGWCCWECCRRSSNTTCLPLAKRFTNSIAVSAPCSNHGKAEFTRTQARNRWCIGSETKVSKVWVKARGDRRCSRLKRRKK